MLLKNLTIGVLAGCVALVLAGCGKDDAPKKDSTPSAQGPPPSAAGTESAVSDTVVEGQARDVVCNMIVKAEGSKDFVYRNTRYYFCSEECLSKFKADPSKMTTGLPGETCVCSKGEMKNCKCGHCKGKEERCPCNDPEPKAAPSDGHEGHDHGSHGH